MRTMQILKLIYSILTIYTVAASSPTCGKSAVTGIFSRVIGGKDAPKGAWPWQALLIRTSLYLPSRIRSRNSVGGGSVINSKWVLSAAHIFDDPNLLRSLATQNWKGFLVVLGMHEYPERLDPLEEGSIVFEPIEVIIHENYDSATYDRDIALIKFGKVFKEQNRRFIEDKTVTDIPLDGSIRAVCLPCYNACDGSEDERKGSSCSKYAESTASGHKSPVTVTGFGSIVARDPMSYSFKYPSKLQQADLKLLNGTECQTGITNVNSIYKKAGHNLKAQYTDHMLCAIGKSKSGNVSDSCQGDSGGPLVTQVGSPSGGVCWIQVGIVSWGLGCATESDRGLIPGYYTNVASQIQWILGKIEHGLPQGVVERKQGVVEGESRGPPIQRALNIQCPILEPPENGVINGPNDNFDIGSIVEYSCDKGYAVKDQNVLKCLPEGKWDQVPMCEEQCKLPAKFSNGKYTKFDMPNAKLLVFQCNDGFKMNGKNVAICNYALDAIWEKFPTCDATSCPPPSPIDNGKVTKSSNEIGGKAKFECNKGYKIVGTYHSVCGKDGNWTPHPKCEEILCTEPETPINGAVSILDSYKIGSEVTFACSDGFKLEGQRVSTCSSEGRWTGNKRICKEMRCPDPDSLSNGRVIGNKYTVRSVITFECNSGFKLDGKSSSTCNTNEEWDIFPRCRVDTSCNVEPPKNGGIYNPKEEYTSGSFIFYYCNTGYDLTGPKYTLCFQSKLNPQPPKCIERN